MYPFDRLTLQKAEHNMFLNRWLSRLFVHLVIRQLHYILKGIPLHYHITITYSGVYLFTKERKIVADTIRGIIHNAFSRTQQNITKEEVLIRCIHFVCICILKKDK